MPSRKKPLGLLLAAALTACCAFSAQADAALPEFSPAAPIPFTSTSGKTTLETVGKTKITCKADTNAGEITSASTVKVVFHLTGCEDKTIACMSPNGAPGEIVTNPLIGVLGYVVNPEVKQVGLDLTEPTGGPLIEFLCGAAVRGSVLGSVIGELTPVNKLVTPPKHFVLKFKQKKGMQAITHLFGEPTDILMTSLGGPLEPSGLSSTDKISMAAPVTIVA
ncbi:MAG: hypothetical protein ACLQBB_09030 [Solirubrobacteraceae bacterium]